MDNKGYFKSDDKLAAFKVARAISETMETAGLRHKTSIARERNIVAMCIGTDRSTGDSLGPLVGDMLVKYKISGVHVYGTLEYPVHARNLEETLLKAFALHPEAYLVAVKPGAGLKKELPAVGNMHITGVVNTGGFMDFLVLQSTRLSVVMKMADIIARGLHMAFNEYSSVNFQDTYNVL